MRSPSVRSEQGLDRSLVRIITTLSIARPARSGFPPGPFGASLDRIEADRLPGICHRYAEDPAKSDERTMAGAGRSPAKLSLVLRPSMALSESDLERELLRKCIGTLVAARAPCDECGRTPLVGEQVHIYTDERVVCELCRPRRRGR